MVAGRGGIRDAFRPAPVRGALVDAARRGEERPEHPAPLSAALERRVHRSAREGKEGSLQFVFLNTLQP